MCMCVCVCKCVCVCARARVRVVCVCVFEHTVCVYFGVYTCVGELGAAARCGVVCRRDGNKVMLGLVLQV
jgi:hypothetical protein